MFKHKLKTENYREIRCANPESGQVVLIAVLLSVSISMLMLFALSLPIADQIRNSEDYLSSKQTLINSESLNDEVLYRLNGNKTIPAVLNMSILTDASYSVIANWDSNTKEVISNSTYRDFTRKIDAVFNSNRTVRFDFGVWISSGGLRMENSSRITGGNVFSMGSVVMTGSATISGSLSTSTSPVNLPISDDDINNWKVQAGTGKIINGNWTITNSTATSTIGPLKITGNLTIRNSSVLTLNGPLYVMGNLDIENSSEMILSPSYGTKSETVVIDGITTLGNSTYLGGSGMNGSAIILATQNTSGCANVNCTGGTPAIDLENSTFASAILVAPHGAVYLSNSASTKSVLANYLYMQNSAEVDYDPNIINTNFNSTASTSYWTLSSLKEI